MFTWYLVDVYLYYVYVYRRFKIENKSTYTYYRSSYQWFS